MTARTGPDLDALANGSVRGRHIFILFALAFVLTFGLSHLVLRQASPLVRAEWFNLLQFAALLGFFALVTLIVPELRGLFVESIRSGTPAPASDVVIAIALMVTWALGASRMLFAYPLVLFDEDWGYRWLGLGRTGTGDPVVAAFATLTAVVLAPVVEEVVFRGYLLNLWLARYRKWFAVLASSLVFGAWHFDRAPFATVAGVIFALVYLKYHSLMLCMLLHALHNALMHSVAHRLIPKERQSVGELSAWAPELFFALLFLPLAWMFWRRFRPQQS